MGLRAPRSRTQVHTNLACLTWLGLAAAATNVEPMANRLAMNMGPAAFESRQTLGSFSLPFAIWIWLMLRLAARLLDL